MNFCRGPFTQHGKDQFKVIHVVSQVLALKALKFLIFTRRNSESRSGYFSGQDFIIPVFLGSALLPLVS